MLEDAFIQKIFQITEQLLRSELTPAQALPDLQRHLDKARQLKMLRYENEVLNTLAIAYYFMPDISQALDCWKQAFAQAQLIDDADLLCKTSSNLAEQLAAIGDTANGLLYVEQGLEVAHTRQLKTIVTLYLYFNKGVLLTLSGRYAEAKQVAQTAWDMVETVDLQKYSRYEYAQIMCNIKELQALCALVDRDAAGFKGHMERFLALTEQMKRDDFAASMLMRNLLFELVLQGDEAAALLLEQKLFTLQNGEIQLTQLTTLATFLFYNQHPWAKKYARQILPLIENQPTLYAPLIDHTRRILAE